MEMWSSLHWGTWTSDTATQKLHWEKEGDEIGSDGPETILWRAVLLLDH